MTDIEHDRFGVPRTPVLKQLARALKLDIDVLYFWGRQIPPDIRAEGLSQETIKEAWRAFRAVVKENNSHQQGCLREYCGVNGVRVHKFRPAPTDAGWG